MIRSRHSERLDKHPKRIPSGSRLWEQSGAKVTVFEEILCNNSVSLPLKFYGLRDEKPHANTVTFFVKERTNQ